ncbi:tetratricopeptide repeat protein [Desulfatiferula olefinivorans]
MKHGLNMFVGVFVFLILAAPAGAESLYSAGKKGREAYDAGDYETALDYYIKAQLEAPDKPEVFYNLGNAQYKTGDFDGAVDQYKKALETTDPRLKERTHYNLGNAYFRKNDLEKAVGEYEKALAIDPDDGDARKNLDFAKKVLEEQKKQEQDDSNRTDGDPNDRQNQDDRNTGDQKNTSDGSESESEPPGGAGDQDQPDAGDDTPEAKDNGDGDDRERTGADDPSASPPGEAPGPDQAGRAGEDRPDDQAVKQAEAMLNRLKDNPGKALMPSYEPRRVDKDW